MPDLISERRIISCIICCSDVSSSNTDPDADPSKSLQALFDSSSGEGEVDLPEEEDTVGLRLSLSNDQVQQLQAVAKQLGLTPSTVAERAIEMVCEEVFIRKEGQYPSHLLIEQYQARLDLLHAVENADGTLPEAEETSDDDETSNA